MRQDGAAAKETGKGAPRRSKVEDAKMVKAVEEESALAEDVGDGGTTKLRRCTHCGRQGHNIRTCPDLRKT
jgi:hypothetical protein